jgi:hypothetical protein
MNIKQLRDFINEATDELENAGFPLEEVDVVFDYATEYENLPLKEVGLYDMNTFENEETGLPFLSIEVAPHSECTEDK